MNKEEIIEEIDEIKNLLTGITSSIEDVKNEVAQVHLNMDDNSRVESLLGDILDELKKQNNDV